jgi:hypothetical protein
LQALAQPRVCDGIGLISQSDQNLEP